MGVSVADQKIENCPAQKGHAVGRGPDALFLQEVKALRQSRTAFIFVFLFGEDPEGLAEVLLMEAHQTSAPVPATVIAGDDEEPIKALADLHRWHRQTHPYRYRHAEGLIPDRE